VEYTLFSQRENNSVGEIIMKPEKTLNVLDAHGGFTAITRQKSYAKVFNENGKLLRWDKVTIEGGTLWRPGSLLKKSKTGELQEYNEDSFYQNNNNVTKAIYKVKGYGYRIAVWFDNATGQRIA
jgi:hypothetical protein